ncbi:MAG TPA: hypothetical protein VI298_09965 [Geobacteraceae bacterium]
MNNSYAYDPMDRIASVTDPFGMQTRYLYDGNGNNLVRV